MDLGEWAKGRAETKFSISPTVSHHTKKKNKKLA